MATMSVPSWLQSGKFAGVRAMPGPAQLCKAASATTATTALACDPAPMRCRLARFLVAWAPKILPASLLKMPQWGCVLQVRSLRQRCGIVSLG